MFWYLMLLAAFCFGAAIGGLLFSFAGWQCVKEIESLTLQLKTINDEYPKLQKKIDKERDVFAKKLISVMSKSYAEQAILVTKLDACKKELEECRKDKIALVAQIFNILGRYNTLLNSTQEKTKCLILDKKP